MITHQRIFPQAIALLEVELDSDVHNVRNHHPHTIHTHTVKLATSLHRPMPLQRNARLDTG